MPSQIEITNMSMLQSNKTLFFVVACRIVIIIKKVILFVKKKE